MGKLVAKYRTNAAASMAAISQAVDIAAASLVHDATEELAEVMRVTLSERQRDWMVVGEKELLKQAPTQVLIDSLRSYLYRINVTVDHTGSTSHAVMETDPARMTDSGYSAEVLFRLMEYGGQISVGGKRYRLPPHPHWRRVIAAVQQAGSERAEAWMKRLVAEVQSRLAVLPRK